MASYTVAAFDWLITIDLEILHVWNSPWSLAKVVYFINRYLPIVDFFLGYFGEHEAHIDTCKALTKAALWLYVISIYAADYILAMRTCAVWGFNKTLVVGLVLSHIGSFFFNVYYFNVHVIGQGPIRVPPLDGCFPIQSGGRNVLAEFSMLVVYDTAMLILMVYPTIKEYSCRPQVRDTIRIRSRLITSVYAEGVLFYVYLLLVSIVTLTIVLEVPDNAVLFLLPNRVIREVLACRVLLHIRELADRRSRWATLQASFSANSELVFA